MKRFIGESFHVQPLGKVLVEQECFRMRGNIPLVFLVLSRRQLPSIVGRCAQFWRKPAEEEVGGRHSSGSMAPRRCHWVVDGWRGEIEHLRRTVCIPKFH